MNKLIAALIAGAFALGSVTAMAQADKTPPQPVNIQELRMQKQMSKDDYAKMSPAEKAAYKKGIAAQRQMEQMDAQAKAQDNPPTSAAEQKALNAQKNAPKQLTTPAQHQDALKAQEKAPGAGGGN